MRIDKKKQIVDKTRNNNYAAAFAYLKTKNKDRFGTQKKLTEAMVVNKDAITNILNYYTIVTDDVITKLQTAAGGIFYFQYLRGQSDVMLPTYLASAVVVSTSAAAPMTFTLLAAKDLLIITLQQQIASSRES